ncbi:MAG TPA: bifunctional hydroxymethylpyrimidine kinase/phosphomethylpyrimidine kinase [Acidobacteriaceae bacterium]
MQPKTDLGDEAESSRVGQTPPVALTIAGFDPSSGAGVTADLKVFAAHGLFGVSAITSLTVQSTMGVAAVEPIKGEFLARTLEHLWADLPAAGVKIGMLGSEEAVRVVAEFLRGIESENAANGTPVVLDPVLRSSSGHELLPAAALEALQTELLPFVESSAGWVTPNWAELGLLAGWTVGNLDEARAAAEALGRRYPGLHVLASGGDAAEPAAESIDLLRMPDGNMLKFAGERIKTRSTHGTGCAFSSAILARLVLGDRPAEAVAGAKAYVVEALRSAPGLGHGRGPLNLLWPLRR